MVVCLERGADLHMGHCHSLSLASVKSRLVLCFWYRLTWVVPGKRAVKRVCVCVCACMRVRDIHGVRAVVSTTPGTHTQPLNGPFSGTTQVCWYQQEHSLTHSHLDHQTSWSSNILQLIEILEISLRKQQTHPVIKYSYNRESIDNDSVDKCW